MRGKEIDGGRGNEEKVEERHRDVKELKRGRKREEVERERERMRRGERSFGS